MLTLFEYLCEIRRINHLMFNTLMTNKSLVHFMYKTRYQSGMIHYCIHRFDINYSERLVFQLLSFNDNSNKNY